MAGYSGTPLAKKLGIRPGHTMCLLGQPEKYFDWISPMPDDSEVKDRLTGEFDFIHFFVKDRKSFEPLFLRTMKHLKPDGMLWVSWPKRSSKVVTDLDENVIREFGLAKGLVDVKVCAVDDTWSALKFVFRLRDRKK